MPNDKQSRTELVERLRAASAMFIHGSLESTLLLQGASAIEALEAENARLREALTFYRDKWAYTPNKRFGGLEWRPTEMLLDDCGNIARSALNPEREEK